MAIEAVNAIGSTGAVKDKISASTQTQALSAILFLYRHILGHQVGTLEGLIRARKPKHLPVVMTKDQVRAVIDQLKDEYRLMTHVLNRGGRGVRSPADVL